jgi:hypothetical protein
MGKKIKLREAQQRAAEQAICARLRAHSRTETGPAFIGSFAEFAPLYQAKIETYRGFALRAPEAWQCRVRVRAPAQRFLELVRFTFARFPVASHLEQAWTDELHVRAGEGRVDAPDEPALIDHNRPDFCHWYILAAQGNSLYREAAHRYISKRETHHFLNAPEEVSSTTRAFCYAIAKAATENEHVALRVARTKIAAFPMAQTFWKDVARFFARNPMPILEMNDLIDFLQAAHEQDADFSVNRRSVPALRRRMADWHRTLREIASGGRWEGRPMADAKYETNGEHGRAVWRFRQLKTGDELYREGQHMHHCVVAYKPHCLAGLASIWSLTCEYPAGEFNRCLTIEVDRDGRIVQCRGFANRYPNAAELAVAQRWADDYGMTW